MTAPPTAAQLLRSIRIWLAVVIIGLFLSGVTAFPLQHELALTLRFCAHIHLAQHAPGLNTWFARVYNALADTNAHYPFLAYGTDWLAFAHLVIAVAFIGPYLDPIRNKWFITWGFLSCAGVPLLALIAGPIRGIPFYWRLIDCSFGVFCCLCLLIIRRRIQQFETITQARSHFLNPKPCPLTPRYNTLRPPSTTRFCPVMYELASEHRNRIAP